MQTEHYKKSWLVTSFIAREMISAQVGDRLPTIQEYTQRIGSSRGVVQSALLSLEAEGGLHLDKRGKMGTFITGLDLPVLFRMADLNFITGSMPAPLNKYLSSLATGICKVMQNCPVPFTFAFVQSAGNRADALRRMVYDFVVVSKASADMYCELYPELETILTLENCEYSPPFVLCSMDAAKNHIEDGCSIAVDPQSADQYLLTRKLCEGKDVHIVECTYVTSRVLLLNGEVDFLVYREEDWNRVPEVHTFPIPGGSKLDMLAPAVVVNRENVGIPSILQTYLNSSQIAMAQRDVLWNNAPAQYF